MKNINNIKKVAVIAFMAAAMYVLTACGTTTIDLNKYIQIETAGYDSYGTVKYDFDDEAFIKDYGDKIKITTKDKELLDYVGAGENTNPYSLLRWKCVGYRMDKLSGISNGDTLTLHWNCNDKVAQDVFNCQLKYKDIEYTVSNLKDVEKFDPFEHVEVSFQGISPDGTVTVTPEYDVKEMQYTCLAGQKTFGDHVIQIALAGERSSDGFLKIASAFAEEDYVTPEEDALDSVCEFINCTSGLFAAEQCKKEVELDMQPVYAYENQKLVGDVYVLPIYIEDCEVKLIIGIDSEVEMGQKAHKFSYEKVESSIAIGLAKGTVGIVDDSKMSRKILRNILEGAGYAVVAEATDGEEGIAVYMQYKPDILTLDITMPNMNGIEALREIMSVDKKARVIMISAAGQQQKIIEALKIGAEKFITKPFEPNDVIANIDGMMKR